MSLSFSPIANAAEKAPSAKLPIFPLAGEMSGRTEGGVTKLNLESSCDDNHILSFAGIDAQMLTAIYFLHNGCVFARVAIGRAKADNASSQMQGEKP